MLVNKQLPCRADPSTIPKHIPFHCDGSHGCLAGCDLHNEELAPRSVRNHLMPSQNIQEKSSVVVAQSTVLAYKIPSTPARTVEVSLQYMAHPHIIWIWNIGHYEASLVKALCFARINRVHVIKKVLAIINVLRRKMFYWAIRSSLPSYWITRTLSFSFFQFNHVTVPESVVHRNPRWWRSNFLFRPKNMGTRVCTGTRVVIQFIMRQFKDMRTHDFSSRNSFSMR